MHNDMKYTLLFLLCSLLLAGCASNQSTNLDSDDDDDMEDVWNDTTAALLAHYGEPLDWSKLPDTHRDFLLVAWASPYIDDAGFWNYLQDDIQGDPTGRLFPAAYRRFGANRAAEAFDLVLSLFPENKLPTDASERIRIYRATYPDTLTKPDMMYRDALRDTRKVVEAYIRNHRAEFLLDR